MRRDPQLVDGAGLRVVAKHSVLTQLRALQKTRIPVRHEYYKRQRMGLFKLIHCFGREWGQCNKQVGSEAVCTQTDVTESCL